jgi:pyrimidine operon attenuation protein/uracil phosphoribosyltransferase
MEPISQSQKTPEATERDERLLLSEADIERTLKRLTHELLEANRGSENIVLIGILTRGKYLAHRLAGLIGQFENREVPVGTLDITLYRDDRNGSFRPLGETSLPFDLTGKRVILVDDVIFRGRTIRAALDALNDYGRPASVQLLVLLDRGHRELPISPNFIGKNVPTATSERVYVRLKETDGVEQVTIQ